jgi:hypothetical protein
MLATIAAEAVSTTPDFVWLSLSGASSCTTLARVSLMNTLLGSWLKAIVALDQLGTAFDRHFVPALLVICIELRKVSLVS